MSATLTYPEIFTKSAAYKILAMLLTVFLIGAAVQAQSVDSRTTAGGMLALCKAKADTAAVAASWALCAGRIQGWMSAHYMSALAYGGTSKRLYCEPSNWTVDQLAATFVKWGTEHPELMSLSWSNGLMKALQESYPCKR